jgi:phycoerythrin-associated linker protein
MANLARSAALGLDAFECDPLELRSNFTEDDLQGVILAVYRQVLGNEHLMECDRLESAEALLRDSSINVRQFVRVVAQSNLYQSLFFNSNSQYRFIELNFKHLLGRAPQDQAEILEHVLIYNEQGYAAEIDSYLDSDEYLANFSEDFVPYPRSIKTQDGLTTECFTQTFSLLRGSATHDRDSCPRLISSLAGGMATPIKSLAMGNGAHHDNTSKRFRITYAANNAAAVLNKTSNQEVVVSFSQMPRQIQLINASAGKVLSVSEA